MTRLAPPDRPPVVRPEGVDEGAVLSVFRVPKESAGMRVDVFMQTQLKNTSRTRAKHIVRVAGFNVDGLPLRPNARVTGGQHIALWRPPWDEEEVAWEIPVLYSDEHLIVISKPPGLPVHPTARYYRNTVTKMLEQRFPSEHLVLAHRLDRETSGVLVVMRTKEADRRIKAQFRSSRGVEKTYLAITWGWLPDGISRIELPLERDHTSRLRCAMRVAAPGTGYAAATRTEMLTRLEHESRRYAVVRCDLETGRQHQIRVHLSSVGCPVVGDKIYGPDPGLHARASDGVLTNEDEHRLEMSRQALHAWRMKLEHPMSGAPLEVVAPVASDMRTFVERMGDGQGMPKELR